MRTMVQVVKISLSARNVSLQGMSVWVGLNQQIGDGCSRIAHKVELRPPGNSGLARGATDLMPAEADQRQ
jgi:hypothetical protein